jgi:heparan-alpha-glucosaminide N-acetyltransferase
METAINNSQRVASIDIFRGITILVMIFVNDLAGVKGLPWWTYHIPPGEDGMTYVDVVFPAFLFIVGMAVPLAIKKRKAQGDTTLKLIYHTFIRALSLVAIGLLIMNGREVHAAETGISYAAWNVLMFIGVILLWNVYPKSEGRKQLLFNILKWFGLLLLIILLVIYRREIDGTSAWMNLSTWSILGLIGWAYLAVVLIYLLTRGKFLWLAISFVLMVALNVASRAGYVDFLYAIPNIIWPLGNGSLASITMGGVLLSRLFLNGDVAISIREKMLYSTVFTILMLLAGWLLMPFGLAKIGATPSWCLYSAAICVIIFMALYWIVDIHKQTSWAVFMKPAGSNPLLTYILPDIYYASFGFYHFMGIAGEGWPGVVKSIIFSLFILGISALMTRWKIRLQL